MIYDTSIEDAIRERFRQLERPIPESNSRQCYRPESAEVLPNPYGTAPGLYLKKDNKILVMLPGPAREMHPMFTDQVVPRLQKEGVFPEIDCYLQLRVLQGSANPHSPKKSSPCSTESTDWWSATVPMPGWSICASALSMPIPSQKNNFMRLVNSVVKPWVRISYVLGIVLLQESFSGIFVHWIKHSQLPSPVPEDFFLLNSRKFREFPKYFRGCSLLPQRRQSAGTRGARKHGRSAWCSQ